MSFLAILQLFMAVLKAPAEIRALILLLSSTPAEKAQEISQRVQKEYEDVMAGSRPKWD